MRINIKEQSSRLIAIIVILILVIGVAIFYIVSKRNQLKDMAEEFSIEKQELEDDYEAISMQYEGFKFSVQNDSLLYKLENEQAKVQRLQEQLRTTDVANKQEIKRLKDELGTLRKILKSYIQQIDSLHRLNAELKAENKEISQKFEESQHSLNLVSQEKQKLGEKVSLAAKLDATNISARAINAKGKNQKKFSKSTQIVTSFTITKNITAEPGEKTIFVRIMAPDGSILAKGSSGTFSYENGDVQYSMKRVIEYSGEEMNVDLYWDIEEFLKAGTYQVDIFADGNRIGHCGFSMLE